MSQGESDGASAAKQSKTDLETTLDYFGLKAKMDYRVFNTTYEEFLEKRAEGQFVDFVRLEDDFLKMKYTQ